MICTYLLIGEDGRIDDTLLTKEDVNPQEGEAITIRGSYYKIKTIDHYIDMGRSPRKIYFIRAEHIPFEKLPNYIQTKMIWDEQNKDDV